MSTKLSIFTSLAVMALTAALAMGQSAPGSGLLVTWNGPGLERLSYNGTVLEDTGQYPADGFHIWHMKVTDLQGNLLGGGQYDWGEVNDGRSWDPGSHAWTYRFRWGVIQAQYQQVGDVLNVKVSTYNNADSGVIFDGAAIYPLTFHFPQLPVGFTDPSYEHLAFNTTGPSVTLADFGAGEVATVLTDASKPLYTGFEPAGLANAYVPIMSGTALDGMASFFPRQDRPVRPGETDSYTVSFRFAPSGTPAQSLAADAYAAWAAAWPSQLDWPDRRILGTMFLASAGEGDSAFGAGYPNNPRRYFNNGDASVFDVRTAGGLAQFQGRVLQQAHDGVANLRRLNAQGAITWDIEGQEYPHSTSYACSPDQIAEVAPEMESVITDDASGYAGMKLDDAYFHILHDAGYRVGVCIRPQQFTRLGNGSAQQVQLPDNQVAAQLIRKMKYAHDRWAATIFYVDSSVDANGAALDAGVLQQVAAALPDSLIIPEESSPKSYAYTAPFQSFLFHTDLGTAPEIYAIYPKAFSVNLVNDVDAAKLATYRPQLTNAVRRGDVLMVHADYWHDNNTTVMQMYQDAGFAGPGPVTVPVSAPVQTPVVPTPVVPTPVAPVPVAPTPVAPVPVAPAPVVVPDPPGGAGPVTILSPASGQTVAGLMTVTAAITHTLDAAGSYLIVDGQPLDGHRVVSEPFAYSLDTRTLTNGVHTIQVWAHDTGNATLLSDPMTIAVAN